MSYPSLPPTDEDVDLLRQRIDELERALSKYQDIAARLRASEAMRTRAEDRFRRLIESAPDAIIITDQAGFMLLVNHQVEDLFGYDRNELLDQSVDILLPERFHKRHVTHRSNYVSDPHLRPMGFDLDLVGRRKDGSEFPIEISLSPLESEDSIQIICSVRDITVRKRAEEERQRLQNEMIQVQEATLRELSTPLIPISDQVVVMPLIGAIDSRRAQQIVETLLEGVSERRAETALIDITGVSVVDTQVANILVQAAQAVQLLGARAVLTGIRPEIAQILVSLGVDLGTLETRADLQSGIAYAVEQFRGGSGLRFKVRP
ncbi:MAG TPA: PAS domain S-box protein [Herpetosiphonaceae bacterium]